MENDLLDAHLDLAQTRTEALRARGYDEATIAGSNGHHPAPAGSNGTAATEPVPACRGCGQPLTGKQQSWCSRSCQKKAQYQADRSRQSPVTPATIPQQALPPAGTVNAGPPAVLPGIDGYRRCAYLLEDGGLLPILTRSR